MSLHKHRIGSLSAAHPIRSKDERRLFLRTVVSFRNQGDCLKISSSTKIGGSVMPKLIQQTLYAFLILSGPFVQCQIPASGAPIPSFIALSWDMTIQEAKNRIHAEIKMSSDTLLIYPDTFLDLGVRVTLKFDSPRIRGGLQSISVQIEEVSKFDSIFCYLKNRYGNYTDRHTARQTKFFVTVQMEVLRWDLKGEEVALIRLMHGSELLGANLLYKKL